MESDIFVAQILGIPLDRLHAYLDMLPEPRIRALYEAVTKPNIIALKGLKYEDKD